MIEKNLQEELPFMATENILMAGVTAGGDRQELHERIREHSVAAGSVVKNEGAPNDLLERIAADPAFQGIDVSAVMNPADYVGRAAEQVDEFVAQEIEPIRSRYAGQLRSLKLKAEVNV